MDDKYLAEIKARCELGRPAQQREVKALLAEVERLQSVVKIQRASCSLVETAKAATIVDGIAAKDQQIDTLKKALELACRYHNFDDFRTIRAEMDFFIQQAQEQEGHDG